jgi:hypothetical protein
MIIRHAEKAVPGGTASGVNADGLPDPGSLIPRGWERAGALISLFVRNSLSHSDPPLPSPTYLVASHVEPQSGSRRAVDTLQPLSERLGLAIDSRFAKGDLAQVSQAVREMDGVVLICWEHHLIPSLAGMLIGDTTTAPSIWPDDRFDVVWLIDLPVPGKPTFRQVPELLLGGDLATVISG